MSPFSSATSSVQWPPLSARGRPSTWVRVASSVSTRRVNVTTSSSSFALVPGGRCQSTLQDNKQSVSLCHPSTRACRTTRQSPPVTTTSQNVLLLTRTTTHGVLSPPLPWDSSPQPGLSSCHRDCNRQSHPGWIHKGKYPNSPVNRLSRTVHYLSSQSPLVVVRGKFLVKTLSRFNKLYSL